MVSKYEGSSVVFKCIHEPTVISCPLMWAVRPWGPATEANSPLSARRPASLSSYVGWNREGRGSQKGNREGRGSQKGNREQRGERQSEAWSKDFWLCKCG